MGTAAAAAATAACSTPAAAGLAFAACPLTLRLARLRSAAAQAGKGLEGEPLGQWLGAQLVRRRLAVRVDRASYKPLPGSKKLVKFPKRIVPLPPAEAGVSVRAGRPAAGQACRGGWLAGAGGAAAGVCRRALGAPPSCARAAGAALKLRQRLSWHCRLSWPSFNAFPLHQVFDEEGFYVWLYQRPTSKWTYVLAALVPGARAHVLEQRWQPSHPLCLLQLGQPQSRPQQGCMRTGMPLPLRRAVAVLAACCFPLAPDWVKVRGWLLAAHTLQRDAAAVEAERAAGIDVGNGRSLVVVQGGWRAGCGASPPVVPPVTLACAAPAPLLPHPHQHPGRRVLRLLGPAGPDPGGAGAARRAGTGHLAAVWPHAVAAAQLPVRGGCPGAESWLAGVSAHAAALRPGTPLPRARPARHAARLPAHAACLRTTHTPSPHCCPQEVPITQLLKPLVSFERPAEGSSKWANHPLTRLAVAGALGGLLFALHRHSPDKGARRGGR